MNAHQQYIRSQSIKDLDDGAKLIGRALDRLPEDDYTGLRKEIARLSNDADKLCGEIVEGRYDE